MHPARALTPPGLTTAKDTPASTGSSAVLPRRTKLLAGLMLMTGLTMLTACGQKGPLYLPDPNDPTKKRT
jgi:Prokaryotic lipoprotein-attachment site